MQPRRVVLGGEQQLADVDERRGDIEVRPLARHVLPQPLSVGRIPAADARRVVANDLSPATKFPHHKRRVGGSVAGRFPNQPSGFPVERGHRGVAATRVDDQFVVHDQRRRTRAPRQQLGSVVAIIICPPNNRAGVEPDAMQVTQRAVQIHQAVVNDRRRAGRVAVIHVAGGGVVQLPNLAAVGGVETAENVAGGVLVFVGDDDARRRGRRAGDGRAGEFCRPNFAQRPGQFFRQTERLAKAARASPVRPRRRLVKRLDEATGRLERGEQFLPLGQRGDLRRHALGQGVIGRAGAEQSHAGDGRRLGQHAHRAGLHLAAANEQRWQIVRHHGGGHLAVAQRQHAGVDRPGRVELGRLGQARLLQRGLGGLMRLGLLLRAKHDVAAGKISETLGGVAGADEEHAALGRAAVAVGEVGERRDRQLEPLGVEAHHRVLADDEVRLRANAAQREVEAFLVNEPEAAAGRLLEMCGELVVAALADAIDARAGERQRQRIHHHHPHRRLGRLAKREREETTGEPDHFFLGASTRMRLARTSIT